MMLNMERMVGTITPKKVLSFRGSLLGDPGPDSVAASDSAPHATVGPARQHTPELIRGVRSFDMAGRGAGLLVLWEEKSMRTGFKQTHGQLSFNLSLMHSSPASP